MKKLLLVSLILIIAGCSGASNQSSNTVTQNEYNQNFSNPKPEIPPINSEDPIQLMGSASLMWNPPVAYTDGTRIDQLSGFKIYYAQNREQILSKKSIIVTVSGDTDNVLIEDLNYGVWFFAITAVDLYSSESDFSEILSKEINSRETVDMNFNCQPKYISGKYRMVCE
jgi:hypothetical protein